MVMIRDKIYKIGKLLGQGAHGRVYQAIRQDDEEWFAIKMIRYIARDMDEYYSARLVFEAELVALDVFKNIPQVIHYEDFETSYVEPTDDQLGECNLVIVFEYAETSLADYVEHKPHQDGQQIQRIQTNVLAQRCETCKYRPFWDGHLGDDRVTIQFIWQGMLLCVDALHEKDYVHRDLKPDNFLIAKGRIVVADLGLSKNLEHLQEPVPVDGTPLFWSPEVISRGDYSKASDIWALGISLIVITFSAERLEEAVAWTMVPPELETIDYIVEDQLFRDFPPNEEVNFRQCLRMCLSRDPIHRPSAFELLEQPFLSGLGFDYFKLKWLESDARSEITGTIVREKYAPDGEWVAIISSGKPDNNPSVGTRETTAAGPLTGVLPQPVATDVREFAVWWARYDAKKSAWTVEKFRDSIDWKEALNQSDTILPEDRPSALISADDLRLQNRTSYDNYRTRLEYLAEQPLVITMSDELASAYAPNASLKKRSRPRTAQSSNNDRSGPVVRSVKRRPIL